MTTEAKKKRPYRRRRKRTKNEYFTKVHEQAIIDYCASGCYKERSKLYEYTRFRTSRLSK